MAKKAATKPAKTKGWRTNPKLNQSLAIRLAMEAGKTEAKAGVAWVKERYGHDVSPDFFGVIKSKLKGKRGQKKVAPEEQNGATADTSWIADLEALARLKRALGKNGFSRVVEAMG